MRIFLAIDLPAKVKEALDLQLDALKKNYPQFTWVQKENFHITLIFFGETEKVKEIKSKITDAIYDAARFHLYSLGTDVFVSKKLILFVDFRREKKLEALVAKVEDFLNLRREKKFVPHLTIARAKLSSKQQYFALKKKMQKLALTIDFPVEKIYLYQSVLEGKRPSYKKLAKFTLIQS